MSGYLSGYPSRERPLRHQRLHCPSSILVLFALSTTACLWDRSGLATSDVVTDSTRNDTGGTAGTSRRTGGNGGRGGAGGSAGTGGSVASEIGGGNPGNTSASHDAGTNSAVDSLDSLVLDGASLGDVAGNTTGNFDATNNDEDSNAALREAGTLSLDAESGGPAKIILRASGITANIVRAKVVYAQTLDAYQANIDQLQRSANELRWQEGLGHPHITEHEIVVDELYVKDLFCRNIVAGQVFTQKATIERR
jgi:hypothetical protein